MSNSTEQLKDLEFEMAWKTRDEIICNLNQHTKLLSGLIIKADAREKMLKANNDLMATLMNLPPKDGCSRSFESLEHDLSDGLNEVVLDLSLKVKSRIVDTLITNHHVVLLKADSSSSETNAKMIDQNNELICELLKLRSRTVSKGIESLLLKSDLSIINVTSKLTNRISLQVITSSTSRQRRANRKRPTKSLQRM